MQMMKPPAASAAVALCALLATALALPHNSLAQPDPSVAQQPRPIPYTVIPPAEFQAAVAQGTRTADGEPGPAYWMNDAFYQISATLRPSENRLEGEQTVQYRNNSDDTISEIMVHLRQNLTRPEAQRNWDIGETTEGMEIDVVRAGGEPLQMLPPRRPGTGYSVQGTVMQVNLPDPLLPGAETELYFRWGFEIPAGAPRMGRDESAYFLGYWYPQIAVYDDVRGWDAEQYRGRGEFYMGFADYDVTIIAPEGWLLAATGVLQNSEDVLAPAVRERLEDAARTGANVAVVPEAERGAGAATLDVPGDTLRWRFRAERVRDFAFGASAEYVWDALAAEVGDADGDGAIDTAMVYAFYRPERFAWAEAVELGRFGLEFMSAFVFPYPYPHATAVEGPFPFGGMEFPMITLMTGRAESTALFEIIVHEFVHNWWPMIVGSNEKRYMWLDEGPTHYATGRAGEAYYGEWRSLNPDDIYFRQAAAGRETEIMRHADLYPDVGQFLTAIYPKPKLALTLLGGLYGEDRVDEALRTYSLRWAFRHPTPWDFFNTFEDVLGTDLDWLWTSWFYETWTLDQFVVGVEESEQGPLVIIGDQGLAPMPVPVEVTYDDGRTERRTISVSPWLAGNREVAALFPRGNVVRAEIDPEQFMPDIDRGDNVWVRP